MATNQALIKIENRVRTLSRIGWNWKSFDDIPPEGMELQDEIIKFINKSTDKQLKIRLLRRSILSVRDKDYQLFYIIFGYLARGREAVVNLESLWAKLPESVRLGYDETKRSLDYDKTFPELVTSLDKQKLQEFVVKGCKSKNPSSLFEELLLGDLSGLSPPTPTNKKREASDAGDDYSNKRPREEEIQQLNSPNSRSERTAIGMTTSALQKEEIIPSDSPTKQLGTETVITAPMIPPKSIDRIEIGNNNDQRDEALKSDLSQTLETINIGPAELESIIQHLKNSEYWKFFSSLAGASSNLNPALPSATLAMLQLHHWTKGQAYSLFPEGFEIEDYLALRCNHMFSVFTKATYGRISLLEDRIRQINLMISPIQPSESQDAIEHKRSEDALEQQEEQRRIYFEATTTQRYRSKRLKRPGPRQVGTSQSRMIHHPRYLADSQATKDSERKLSPKAMSRADELSLKKEVRRLELSEKQLQGQLTEKEKYIKNLLSLQSGRTEIDYSPEQTHSRDGLTISALEQQLSDSTDKLSLIQDDLNALRDRETTLSAQLEASNVDSMALQQEYKNYSHELMQQSQVLNNRNDVLFQQVSDLEAQLRKGRLERDEAMEASYEQGRAYAERLDSTRADIECLVRACLFQLQKRNDFLVSLDPTISPEDFSTRFSEIISAYQNGTGEFQSKMEQLQRWIEDMESCERERIEKRHCELQTSRSLATIKLVRLLVSTGDSMPCLVENCQYQDCRIGSYTKGHDPEEDHLDTLLRNSGLLCRSLAGSLARYLSSLTDQVSDPTLLGMLWVASRLPCDRERSQELPYFIELFNVIQTLKTDLVAESNKTRCLELEGHKYLGEIARLKLVIRTLQDESRHNLDSLSRELCSSHDTHKRVLDEREDMIQQLRRKIQEQQESVRTLRDSSIRAHHREEQRRSWPTEPIRLSHNSPYTVDYQIKPQYTVVINAFLWEIEGISRVSRISKSYIVSVQNVSEGHDHQLRLLPLLPIFITDPKTAQANAAALYAFSKASSDIVHPAIRFRAILERSDGVRGSSFAVEFQDGQREKVSASTLIRWGAHVAHAMGNPFLERFLRKHRLLHFLRDT